MNFNNNTFTLQIVHLHHLNFPLTLVDDPSYIEGNLLKLLYIYDVRHLNHSDMTGTSVQNLNLKNRNRDRNRNKVQNSIYDDDDDDDRKCKNI